MPDLFVLEGHQTSSIKVVVEHVTAKKHQNLPFTLLLPSQSESEPCSFILDSFSDCQVQITLYPAFGTQVLARALVLPDQFLNGVKPVGDGQLEVGLLDSKLNCVGRVVVHYLLISPFRNAEMGFHLPCPAVCYLLQLFLSKNCN